MRYVTVPKPETLYALRDQKTGEPIKLAFVDYLDQYVFAWPGWRTRDDVRQQLPALATAFRGQWVKVFEGEGDGKRLKSATHTLDSGTVIEIADVEWEALCKASDGCDVAPHMIVYTQPFGIAIHNASTVDPRPAVAEPVPEPARLDGHNA
jgi:hypothetical protein